MTFSSERLGQLPPYLLSVFQKRKLELMEKGVKVIDLGIGTPDGATPDFIVENLIEEAKKPENHRYSPYGGSKEFKKAVADFYQYRYGVELNPETEVTTLVGSKEGIAHFIQAVVNPGDVVLVPDPGFPVYRNAAQLAGAEVVSLPLVEELGFAPDFQRLQERDLKRAKLMFLNYPNNPTGGTVELGTFLEAITIAGKYNIIVVHDAAYDLLTFGGHRSPSILQVPDAKNLPIVEFGSLSKSFNMTGWRIGYLVGNKELIQLMAKLKTNIDSPPFLAIQKAASLALKSDLSSVKRNCDIYEQRMEKMYQILTNKGFHTNKTKGTFYMWVKVPGTESSIDFAHRLLDETGIVVTPGIAFGPLGEGFFRISLTVGLDTIDEIAQVLEKITL